MSESAATLNQRFGISGIATVVEGNGGIPAVRIATSHCTGEVCLIGGHVTRWKPADSMEVLWLSDHSLYSVGKAIRGGVPVIFPWFGAKADDPKAGSHGFVRNRMWELESINANDDTVTVTLLVRSDASTKPLWPSDFELRLRAAFGVQLTLQLEITNTDKQPLRAEEALHSYFTVGDVRQAAIEGLDATAYIDKTDGNTRKTQSGNVRITAETDRVYLDTANSVRIVDPVLRRRILIKKEHSLNSVVWNPWIEKAHSLSDFGDDEWPSMVCVEPSNVGTTAVELAPGQQHTMTVHISTSAM